MESLAATTAIIGALTELIKGILKAKTAWANEAWAARVWVLVVFGLAAVAAIPAGWLPGLTFIERFVAAIGAGGAASLLQSLVQSRPPSASERVGGR